MPIRTKRGPQPPAGSIWADFRFVREFSETHRGRCVDGLFCRARYLALAAPRAQSCRQAPRNRNPLDFTRHPAK